MTNNKLNIAMFGQKHVFSREGGVEVVVKELTTRMASKGHRIVCYDRSSHNSSENIIKKYKRIKVIPVWTIDKKGLAAMTSSLSAAWRSSRSKADIIHIHAEGPAAMCFIPKLKGKKVIVTIHGLDWKRAKWNGFAKKYIKWGEKQAVKYADKIIVLSKNAQEYFYKTYNRETVYIPNGIKKPILQKAKIITEEWGLKKNSYVLYVGRIVPEKGLNYLLEAWRKIKNDKKLVIVGDSSDTCQYFNDLKKIASDSVLFVGFQQGDILSELYSNAYIYVLPSDLEGMPLSLLEAMSYGNCCLVSDIPECVEVVSNKAEIFKKSRIDDLERKLKYLIEDEKIVQKYKEESANYILDKYKWDDIVDKTLHLYME